MIFISLHFINKRVNFLLFAKRSVVLFKYYFDIMYKYLNKLIHNQTDNTNK